MRCVPQAAPARMEAKHRHQGQPRKEEIMKARVRIIYKDDKINLSVWGHVSLDAAIKMTMIAITDKSAIKASRGRRTR